jgi:uncharacterized protein YdaU (DUF1376 family)
MRHFAHHIGDYAAATAHLSMLEDAAYHRLLRLYYQNEGPLTADEDELMRRVRAVSRHEKTAVRSVLQEFFTLSSDGWHQSRADKEINTYKGLANRGRTNGVNGGRPKANREETATTSQEPVTNSVAKATGARAPARDVIFAEALPWLERRSGKNCRALVGKWLSEIKDDAAILELLQAAEQENPVDPVSWISARLKPPDAHETYDQRRIRLGNAAIEEAMAEIKQREAGRAAQ